MKKSFMPRCGGVVEMISCRVKIAWLWGNHKRDYGVNREMKNNNISMPVQGMKLCLQNTRKEMGLAPVFCKLFCYPELFIKKQKKGCKKYRKSLYYWQLKSVNNAGY